jgi:hypothetical protein
MVNKGENAENHQQEPRERTRRQGFLIPEENELHKKFT